MKLDFDNLMSRADFYDQAWYATSPYRNWGQRFGIAPTSGIRSSIIAGKNPGVGNYSPQWLADFNSKYDSYLGMFNRKQDQLAEQAKQLADFQAQEIQQRQALAQQELAISAAGASLRILQMPKATAPTAPTTRAPRNAVQRRGTAGSDLRIGATPAAAGVGLNIGG